MNTSSLSILVTCLSLGACSTNVRDTSASIDGVSGVVAQQCIQEEPDIPYNLDINCGDSLVPVLAAFNEKTDGQFAFAPHPDAIGGCPFLVEGATIHADAVENCLEITALDTDAATEGSKDTGKDRVVVSWCWYTDSGVECESDHMTIRYSCDDSSESQHDSSWPLHGSDCDAYPDTKEPDTEEPVSEEPASEEPVSEEPAPECTASGDCLTGEFCDERGLCLRRIG